MHTFIIFRWTCLPEAFQFPTLYTPCSQKNIPRFFFYNSEKITNWTTISANIAEKMTTVYVQNNMSICWIFFVNNNLSNANWTSVRALWQQWDLPSKISTSLVALTDVRLVADCTLPTQLRISTKISQLFYWHCLCNIKTSSSARKHLSKVLCSVILLIDNHLMKCSSSSHYYMNTFTNRHFTLLLAC